MAITVTSDIYGTTQVLGYDSANGESVIRRHFVEGVTAVGGHDAAIFAAASSAVPFATAFPTLGGTSYGPLAMLNRTSKQVGAGRYIVEERYGWINSNWGKGGSSSLAEYRLGYEAVPIFTEPLPLDATSGLPAVTNPLYDGATLSRLDIRPRSRSWMRPIIRMGFPYQSSTNPIGTYAGLAGKVNSNSRTVGGLTFTAGQLRFDGCEISAKTNSGYKYSGTVNFSAAKSFSSHCLTQSASTGLWVLKIVSDYESATFP
jgi:hypothetical protein